MRRRIHPAATRSLIFAVMILIAGIVTLPAAALIEAIGTSDQIWVRRVTGPAWNAEAEDAWVGGVPVGDVAASVRPGTIMTGAPVIDIAGPGGSFTVYAPPPRSGGEAAE